MGEGFQGKNEAKVKFRGVEVGVQAKKLNTIHNRIGLTYSECSERVL